MTLPIEDAAMEYVQNDSSLNIHKGRIAAYKALFNYLKNNVENPDNTYIPDIPEDDQRLDDVAMTSYNSIRNSWIAMYEHWKYPGLFVVVEGVRGSIYTQVNKHVDRYSDHTQAKLF